MAITQFFSPLASSDFIDRRTGIDLDPLRKWTTKYPWSLGRQTAPKKKNVLAFIVLVSIFTLGLAFGGLVIHDWFTLPGKSASDQSLLDYQRMFVTWVANKYWQTNDAAQAQQYLADWKRDDLAWFLPTLTQETMDIETRKHLIALSQALRLPVAQSTYSPAQSPLDYQKLFVTWVANKYWQSGDTTQAQNYLASWRRDDLAKLLTTLQRETNDIETRRHLVALTDALRLPVAESSLLSLVLEQPLMLLGVVLMALPLFAAMGFITLPRIQKRLGKENAILESSADGAEIPKESLDDLIGELQPVGGAETPAQTQEQEKKAEPPVEEEADPASLGMGDLASLFEEEDTSLNVLEVFCKGMPEVSVDELVKLSEDVVSKFQNGAKRALSVDAGA